MCTWVESPHSTWDRGVQSGLGSHLGKTATLSSLSQALGGAGHFLIDFAARHDLSVHMCQFLLAHPLPRMCLRSDPLDGFSSEHVQPSGTRGLSGKVLLSRECGG